LPNQALNISPYPIPTSNLISIIFLIPNRTIPALNVTDMAPVHLYFFAKQRY